MKSEKEIKKEEHKKEFYELMTQVYEAKEKLDRLASLDIPLLFIGIFMGVLTSFLFLHLFDTLYLISFSIIYVVLFFIIRHFVSNKWEKNFNQINLKLSKFIDSQIDSQGDA